jgi:hypothetical protein
VTESGQRTSEKEIPKTGLEIWSDFWHEYIELRPALKNECRWMTENSQEMKELNAHLVDAAIKYAAQKKGNGTHGYHTSRNGAGGQPAVARQDQFAQRIQPGQSNQQTEPTHHQMWEEQVPIKPNGSQMSHMDFFNGPSPIYNPGYPYNRGNHWNQRSFGNGQYQNWNHRNFRYGYYPHGFPGPYPMFSKYSKTTPNTNSLAAVVFSPEFIPQSKLQAEIDTLKRTLNELTLKAAVP